MSEQRIIDEKYWTQFITVNKKTFKKSHDGHRFEELVKQLLDLMYKEKNIDWLPTQITHDGNKDFKATYDDQLYWAECKNYKSKIDLKTLAATLVMAEIEDVNVIIFFCYSQINEPTKKKLNSFSRSTNKVIYFFDGCVLDQLILKYAESILPEFFPDFKEIYQKGRYTMLSATPTVLCYVERNPSTKGAVAFEIKNLDELQELKIGEIIGVHIIAINNNLNKSVKFTFQFSLDNNVNPFEILDYSANVKDDKITWNAIEIEPGATFHKIIYLKFKIYRPIIQIPKLTYSIDKKSNHFQFGSITTLRTTFCPFMGNRYLQQIDDIFKNCGNQKRISGILLYGSSGTGKTRMLHECNDRFLSAGYKIINFCNLSAEYSAYAMLHELIFALYGFTDEIIDLIIQNNYENLANYEADTYKEIFRILKLLYTNKSELDAIDETEYFCIYEKLTREKNFLVFDDLQYLSDSAVKFIKGFWKYAINMNRDCYCAIAIAVNTDTLFNQKTIEFLSDFSNSNYEYRRNFWGNEIVGFENEGQANVFLREILGIDEVDYDMQSEDTYSLRPKYIMHIARYLLDQNIVQTVNNKVFVINKAEFKKTINNLPKTTEEILDKRWNLFLKNHSDFDYKQLICCLLFWGKLNCSDPIIAKQISAIRLLSHYGFVKETAHHTDVYIFEHDSIKIYFKKIYPNWFEQALESVSRSNFQSHVNGQKLLCKIHCNNSMNDKDISILRRIDLPEHLLFYTYYLWLRTILQQEQFLHQYSVYENIKFILNDIREKKGEKSAERLYQYFEETYDVGNHKISYSEYRDILLGYAENQLKLKNTQKSIEIYSNIVNKLNYNNQTDQNILSSIYNRWFVCGRVGGACQQYQWQWNESLKIARQQQQCGMCIENHFDKAQSLMLDLDLLDMVEYYLKKGCDAFEYKQIPSLQGHYLYRKIQYLFLRKRYSEVWGTLQECKTQVLLNTEIKSKLFFRIHFLIFEIMLYLMNEYECNDLIIENLLESLIILQTMQNKSQLYRCYYLYGKYYIKKRKFEKAFLIYKKTFEVLNKNVQTEEITVQKKMIFYDMIINFKKNKFFFGQFDFSAFDLYNDPQVMQIINYSDNEFKKFLSEYRAYATVTNQDGTDGYLLF